MNWGLQTIGYSFAALAYFGLAVALVVRWRGRIHARWLAVAVITTTAWGGVLACYRVAVESNHRTIFLMEFLNDGAWLILLAVFLGGSARYRSYHVIRYGGLVVTSALLVLLAWFDFVGSADPVSANLDPVLYGGAMLNSLFAIVILEQIYRNSRLSQRSGLKFLCLGIGTIFIYDLLLYTDALLTNRISELLWSVRGFVVSMSVPLIAVSMARSPNWPGGVVVSRTLAFYSATLVFAIAYIIIVGISGFYIRDMNGNWGEVAQFVFLAAAFLFLSVLLVSEHVRSRLRVFIAKNFYESKYDYRDEWLRLINTLTAPADSLSLRKRAIKSLAQVVNASSGQLWLKASHKADYRCAAAWNSVCGQAVVRENHSIIQFLQDTGWVIDVREYEISPETYRTLTIGHDIDGLSEASLIVPLLHNEELLGFVAVRNPRKLPALNFEDHDLLRTAGKQIASYLAQELATEQLTEGRQFEAFSKLTAYLMHDLKNVVAQQVLVVENAQKHRDKPEFVDDAIETIRLSVIRLRRIIEHLQQRKRDDPPERTELGKLILTIVSQCSDRQPVPTVALGDNQRWVWAKRERLMMAIYHVVRNAQDATPSEGQITIDLVSDRRTCVITVTDTGVGMDEAFVLDRLFRPFDSTKGTQGMGIGAYQMRETIRSMGGDVTVTSKLESGTGVTITLPLAN